MQTATALKVEQPIVPIHYVGTDGIELIDVIERYGLPVHVAVAIQHLVGGARKGDLSEAVTNARWYLNRYLQDENENCQPADPLDDCLEWRSPAQIIQAFGLSGNVAIAVTYLLNAAAFGDDDLEIEKALMALEGA